MSKPVVIIGGGLCGLTLAFRLQQMKQPFLLLEADDALGGRIKTITAGARIELGATWFSSQHQSLNQLLAHLEIGSFPQYNEGVALFEAMSFVPPQQFHLPPNDDPSYRIKGGSSTLIESLAAQLPKERILLQAKVRNIHNDIHGVKIICADGMEIAGLAAVVCLPPAITEANIQFSPHLNAPLVAVMRNTQTWMSESIKFGVSYSAPFWREKGISGTIFSQVGPITEAYDHCDENMKSFAIKGFLHGSLSVMGSRERELMVKAQLTRLLGEDAGRYLRYTDTVWKENDKVFTPYQGFQIPHQNAGHPVYQEWIWPNRLLLAGSETAQQFGGYMEGAIQSAGLAASLIWNAFHAH